MPVASLIACKVQQCLGSLRLSLIIEANDLVRELISLKLPTAFLKANGIKSIRITTFSEASNADAKKSMESLEF